MMLEIKRFYGFKDMKQLLMTLSALLLLVIGISANAGKIYRWQDDAGTWHYTATPPADATAESINIKVTPPSGPNQDITDKSTSDKDPESNTNEKEKASTDTQLKKSAEVAKEDNALAKKNCANAKANLANLQNHRRLRIRDDELGEERYLGDDEHKEWLDRSKEEVRKYCQ
jgi:Domain of unknown function (DUF4124)